MDNKAGPQWRRGQKSKLKRALLNLKLNKSIQKGRNGTNQTPEANEPGEQRQVNTEDGTQEERRTMQTQVTR